jgi:ADP-ribosylation factor related protein 1
VNGMKLLLWDLGGQSGLRVIWEKYYAEAHALIFVIDAADPSRTEESHQELENILSNEDLSGAPVLILANKQDLDNSMSAEEISKLLNFSKVDVTTSKRSFHIEQISALNG